MRRSDLQLVGDRVRFVVGTNELVIEAEPGNLVSIDDAARGTRATAEGAVRALAERLHVDQEQITLCAIGHSLGANNAILTLALNGTGTLSLTPSMAGGGTVHLVLDVSGWFE